MIYRRGFHRCRIILHRPLQTVLRTMTLLLMMAASGYAFDRPPAAGAVSAFHVGLAAHDVDGLWSGESKEAGPDLFAEVIFNYSLFQLFSATAYPNAGIYLNTRGDTSKLFGGFLLQWKLPASFFFSTGLGLALHNGEQESNSTDQKSLGSQVLFRIPIEIGYAVNRHHQILLVFDHVSNAYLASPNEGMDTLGLVYGYRF
jgi:lipid A 3-O-deacylase